MTLALAHRSLAVLFIATFTSVLLDECRTAKASPGMTCEHQRDCSRNEVCVADCATCNVGRCAAIRVLP